MRSSLALAEPAKRLESGILPFVRSGVLTNWLAGRGIANGGAELVGASLLGLAAGDGSEDVDCPFYGAKSTGFGGAV